MQPRSTIPHSNRVFRQLRQEARLSQQELAQSIHEQLKALDAERIALRTEGRRANRTAPGAERPGRSKRYFSQAQVSAIENGHLDLKTLLHEDRRGDAIEEILCEVFDLASVDELRTRLRLRTSADLDRQAAEVDTADFKRAQQEGRVFEEEDVLTPLLRASALMRVRTAVWRIAEPSRVRQATVTAQDVVCVMDLPEDVFPPDHYLLSVPDEAMQPTTRVRTPRRGIRTGDVVLVRRLAADESLAPGKVYVCAAAHDPDRPHLRQCVLEGAAIRLEPANRIRKNKRLLHPGFAWDQDGSVWVVGEVMKVYGPVDTWL